MVPGTLTWSNIRIAVGKVKCRSWLRCNIGGWASADVESDTLLDIRNWLEGTTLKAALLLLRLDKSIHVDCGRDEIDVLLQVRRDTVLITCYALVA